MLISHGSPRVFIDRPISLALLIASLGLLILLPAIRRTRKEAFVQEEV